MTLAAPASAPGELSFTDEDFRKLSRLARAEFGLSLAESKKPLVYSRIAKRLRSLNMSRFEDYIALLERPDGSEERMELISALTTNVTSFFREKHHFEILGDRLMPDLVSTARAGGRVRIWSAGCSSGQEPFSLAMTLLEALPEAPQLDVKILATDIDPVIVRRASAARYATEDLENVPTALRQKWTEGDPAGGVRMGDAVRRLVTFAELNLVSAWPFNGPFDAIFCRNVAIYFDKETQQALWANFARILRDDGLLFIGHSERVSGPVAARFASIGVTAYQKK